MNATEQADAILREWIEETDVSIEKDHLAILRDEIAKKISEASAGASDKENNTKKI